ncbi:MAG: hypothetical protein WBV82_00630 [Myxococcaceae bacterium]
MAGVYNGAALNNLDDDNAKDAALRLEAYPLDGFVLAGVVYSSFGQRRDENAFLRDSLRYSAPSASKTFSGWAT